MSSDYNNWSMENLRQNRDEWEDILNKGRYRDDGRDYSYIIRKLTAINAEIARRIPQRYLRGQTPYIQYFD